MKPAFHTAPAELSPREVTRVRISLCHSVPATDLRAPTFPFLVELGDGGADGKAPGENRKILEFFGDGVSLDSFLDGYAGLVHFLRVLGEVVEDRARQRNAFLTAELAVTGNEESVFVESSEVAERSAPGGNRGGEGDRIPGGEEQVAGEDDVLVGDAGDDVGAGVAWVGLEDSGDAAEINRQGELPGVERMVGKGEDGAVGERPNSSGGVDIGLRALAFCIVLGALNALLEGRQGFVAVHALKRNVAFDDAGRDAGMGPDGNALRAVEGVAERMIKVIVRVEGGANGHWAEGAQGVHLESGAGRRSEAFDEQGSVAADEEAAIADGLGALGEIGDGGVDAVADLADGGEAFVHQRCLGYARVLREVFAKGREWNQFGESDGGAEARSGCQKAATRKGLV